LGNVHTLNLI